MKTGSAHHLFKHGAACRVNGKVKCGPEYLAWADMRRRCLNPKSKDWPRYGGRGIKIDPAWDDYSVFIADMGPRPHGHSLERVNLNGNYERSNCIWATRVQQNRNNSRVRLSLEAAHTIRSQYKFGRQIADIAAYYGVSERAIKDVLINRTWRKGVDRV